MTYTYDQAGNVLTQTDGDDNITTNTYDGNQLIEHGRHRRQQQGHQLDEPTPMTEAGNVLTQTDGDGNMTTNTYDGNQLMSTVVTDARQWSSAPRPTPTTRTATS